MRVQRLGVVPPSFSYAEAARALATTGILAGHHAVMAENIRGVTMLFMYANAVAVSLLGDRLVAQRLLVAFLSVLAIPLVYALCRRLFGSLGRRRGGTIGVFAALGLATSYWYLHFSRVGAETGLVPTVVLLALVLFWEGVRGGRILSFVFCGISVGAGIYLDPGLQLLPIVLLLFAFCLRFGVVRSEDGAGLAPACDGHALIVAGVGILAGTVVACAPLAVYFAGQPAEWFRRGSEAFFLRPGVNHGAPLATLWHSVIGTLLTFGYAGDPAAAANLPGRPALGVVLGALFWVSVVLCIIRPRRVGNAFCLVWLAVMMLPAVLVPERVPNHASLLAVAPVAYILIAVALENVWQGIRRLGTRVGGGSRLLALFGVTVVGVLYVATGLATVSDYFGRWAPGEAALAAFDGPDRELAALIARDDPQTIYLLPYDVLWSAQPHALLQFYYKDGGASAVTVHANELEVPWQLDQALAGKSRAKLVEMAVGRAEFLAANADPKHLLRFYLDQHGRLLSTTRYAGGQIFEYELPVDGPAFQLPLQFLGHGVAYDRQLWLQSSALGNASRAQLDESAVFAPGDTAWLILQWDILNPNLDDYIAHLRLLDAAADIILQEERLLLDDVHAPSSRWVKRDVAVLDFYLLALPADLPSRTYTLAIGVYSPATGEYLPIQGEGGATFHRMRDLEIATE